MLNAELIKRIYRRNAYYYDIVTQAFSSVRTRAILQLELRGGETVLDFGCGTGLSFEPLEKAIGANGRIIGVELSPAMLVKAREKIAQHKWENITLIEANAEDVVLPQASVDAVLSFYTHDIMSSPRAVEKAVQALRPGGRLVVAGSKLVEGRWAWLLNWITLAYAGRAITQPLTIRPWHQLEALLDPIIIQQYLGGTSYIASTVKGS